MCLDKSNDFIQYDRKYVEEIVEKSFTPPQFDIIDFRSYYDKSEYDELVKQYYTFTRGINKSQKLEYLNSKLFGEKLQEQADLILDTKLKSLYKAAGIDPGKEKSMYELFEKVIPHEMANESPHIQNEKKARQKFFYMNHKKNFDKLWNLYKQEKYESYQNAKLLQTDSSK